MKKHSSQKNNKNTELLKSYKKQFEILKNLRLKYYSKSSSF